MPVHRVIPDCNAAVCSAMSSIFCKWRYPEGAAPAAPLHAMTKAGACLPVQISANAWHPHFCHGVWHVSGAGGLGVSVGCHPPVFSMKKKAPQDPPNGGFPGPTPQPPPLQRNSDVDPGAFAGITATTLPFGWARGGGGGAGGPVRNPRWFPPPARLPRPPGLRGRLSGPAVACHRAAKRSGRECFGTSHSHVVPPPLPDMIRVSRGPVCLIYAPCRAPSVEGQGPWRGPQDGGCVAAAGAVAVVVAGGRCARGPRTVCVCQFPCELVPPGGDFEACIPQFPESLFTGSSPGTSEQCRARARARARATTPPG